MRKRLNTDMETFALFILDLNFIGRIGMFY